MDTVKDGVPTATDTCVSIISTNSAYRISAALTYTAQLVNLLSYYLDVRLPFKINYRFVFVRRTIRSSHRSDPSHSHRSLCLAHSPVCLHSDFCKSELTEQSFTRKVFRLNGNILHLCYTQCVKLNMLSLNHTLENINILLDSKYSDLGRIGAVESNDGFCGTTNFQIYQKMLGNADSGSEDDGNYIFQFAFAATNSRSYFVHRPRPFFSFPCNCAARGTNRRKYAHRMGGCVASVPTARFNGPNEYGQPSANGQHGWWPGNERCPIGCIDLASFYDKEHIGHSMQFDHKYL